MSLRSWLRKTPQPDRLRIHTVDGDERILELSSDVRGKWKAAEESIIAAQAVTVECLGSTGKDGQPRILRAKRIEYDDGEGPDDGGISSEEKAADKIVTKRMAETANVLDAYGKRLNEATKLGLESKLGATDQLIALVTTLTEQITGFILNMSSLAKTVGDLLQNGNEKRDSNPVVDKLAGLAMMRMLGVTPEMAAAAAAAQQKPNNGKKGGSRDA